MKKNGKTLMLFLIILFLMVLTWFIPTGTFNEGAFVSNGTNPAGIFDLFVLYLSGILFYYLLKFRRFQN